MSANFSDRQADTLLQRGFTRRHFGRLSALINGAAAMPFFSELTLAQAALPGPLPPGAVKINSNESPYGPCPEAIEAMTKVLKNGNRYMHELATQFAGSAADMEGLKANYVMPFGGSSDPLVRVALAYTSPTKPLVMATLGYEAAARTAEFIGAKVIRVPVKPDGSHDVEAMLKAHPEPGVIYICNPNNPGGGITKRSDIEYALANKPKGSVLLLDECYIQFTDEPVGVDLVAKDKEVIVLRTFSKLYGMAGLRAGLAYGRPDLLARLPGWGTTMVASTGMAGGLASLKSKTVVPERKKLCKDAREDTYSFFEKKNIKYVTGYANFFMVDCGSEAKANDVRASLEKDLVYVGRPHKTFPNLVRVTVGTMEEMKKFQSAIGKAMA